MGFPDEIRRLLNSAGADDEVRLDATSIQTLASGLLGLVARQRGWITFEDYRPLRNQGKLGGWLSWARRGAPAQAKLVDRVFLELSADAGVDLEQSAGAGPGGSRK